MNATNANALPVSTLAGAGDAVIHRRSRLSLVDRFARRLLFSRLASLRYGRIRIADASGELDFAGAEPGPDATITVASPRFYRSLALHGTLGAAESYMRGEWTADDLTALVRLLTRNRRVWESSEPLRTPLRTPQLRVLEALRRNTRRGARRNIHGHYDLGTDFFALFLDPTMSYSCAYFETLEATLEEASRAKIDLVCRKLDLRPEDHLLEIGTGWGELALHAASRFGCRVTTTTISREQHDLASRRVREAGLANRITVLRKDYRDLEGTFDKLVSIEMIEAVGDRYFDAYFRAVSDRLAPHGRALIQAITIEDRAFESARRSTDFIKRYIFPGSCIPSVTALLDSTTRSSDLRLVDLEDITPHYARTLREWRVRFLENLPRVRALGFSEEFVRMWEYYLCYCEGGFAERYIGDVQLLFAKPLHGASVC
jgi:cyclopropane-fatty-acyl-phospholipid synthase